MFQYSRAFFFDIVSMEFSAFAAAGINPCGVKTNEEAEDEPEEEENSEEIEAT